MKNISLKASLLAVAVATTMTLTACGGGGDGDNYSTANNPALPAKQVVDSKKEVDNSVDFSSFHDSSPVTLTSAPADSYDFTSKFDPAKSAVSYTGQTARHALIDDMAAKFKSYAEGDSSTIDADMKLFMEEGFNEEVNFVLDKIAGKAGGIDKVIPGPTYGDISSGKYLEGKLAGNDKPEHITGTFTPWLGATTPTEVVYKLIDALKTEVSNGTNPVIATLKGDEEITETYIDDKGRNYNQLVQKYLLMAVAFNQGASDYLRSDFTGMDNATGDKGTKPYTTAEHKWDEGFGYFGASRNYGTLSDADIKSKLVSDINGDGNIDIRSEANQGAAVNCAKRDIGSAGNANPTNFTKQAFDAFVTGRSLLSDVANTGAVVDEAKLNAAADQAAYVWEQCVAATVVHYINDTNSDLDKFVTNNGVFNDAAAYKDFAKHWSEMKGFAIGLQFNNKSPFHSSAEAKTAYDNMITKLMGEHPEFGSVDEAKAYQAKLIEARDLLQSAYAFDAENVAKW